MNVTTHDLVAIKELIFDAFIFGIFLAFIFYGLARNVINKTIARFNFPQRIRTEDGYLYRSQNGTYVSKQREKDIQLERKLKHKDRWIRIHKDALKRLNECDQAKKEGLI